MAWAHNNWRNASFNPHKKDDRLLEGTVTAVRQQKETKQEKSEKKEEQVPLDLGDVLGKAPEARLKWLGRALQLVASKGKAQTTTLYDIVLHRSVKQKLVLESKLGMLGAYLDVASDEYSSSADEDEEEQATHRSPSASRCSGTLQQAVLVPPDPLPPDPSTSAVASIASASAIVTVANVAAVSAVASAAKAFSAAAQEASAAAAAAPIMVAVTNSTVPTTADAFPAAGSARSQSCSASRPVTKLKLKEKEKEKEKDKEKKKKQKHSHSSRSKSARQRETEKDLTVEKAKGKKKEKEKEKEKKTKKEKEKDKEIEKETNKEKEKEKNKDKGKDKEKEKDKAKRIKSRSASQSEKKRATEKKKRRQRSGKSKASKSSSSSHSRKANHKKKKKNRKQSRSRSGKRKKSNGPSSSSSSAARSKKAKDVRSQSRHRRSSPKRTPDSASIWLPPRESAKEAVASGKQGHDDMSMDVAGRKAFQSAATGRTNIGVNGRMDAVPGVNPQMRPGDWFCPLCGAHNYSSKAQCFRCVKQPPHAPSSVPNASMPFGCNASMPHGMAGMSMAMQAPVGSIAQFGQDSLQAAQLNAARRLASVPSGHGPVRSGDWFCPVCNAHNFASKSKCFRCMKGMNPRVSGMM